MTNPNWWWIENIVTVIAITAIVLGLYAMGAGGFSAVGFILFFNLNMSSRKTTTEKKNG